MTDEEIDDERGKLAKEIGELMNAFSNKTGKTIDTIKYITHTDYYDSNRKFYLVLNITLED